jgi:hypothetical protein
MLNSIKSKGRTVIIERSGRPVTRMEPPGKAVCLKDLPRLLRELPKLGAEAEILEKELREIAKAQSPLSPDSPWKR